MCKKEIISSLELLIRNNLIPEINFKNCLLNKFNSKKFKSSFDLGIIILFPFSK